MKSDATAGGELHLDIAVALPVRATYTYRVPQALCDAVSVGKRALIPFAQRRVTGYILGPTPPPDEVLEVKPIIDVLDDAPLFPASMIALFKWAAAYYIHPVGQVIAGCLPGGLNLMEQSFLMLTPLGREALTDANVQGSERQILALLDQGPRRRQDLEKSLAEKIPGTLILSLQKSGRIRMERRLGRSRTRPKTERYVARNRTLLSTEGLSAARLRVLDAFSDRWEMPLKELRSRAPRADNVIGPLRDAGYIRIYEKNIYRDPFGEPIAPDTPPPLTTEQQHAVEQVVAALGTGSYNAFLLSGITGSGKTEVYLHAAAAAIKRGGSVVVLVPEIALISQMERRFRARFGDCVALLHSGLSNGERFDQWRRILDGEATIAIGARSAVFAPFDRVGLIIVDEEHDLSYKQESHLRYNARDLAVVRASQQGSVVLLGSATPSLQSYYNVTVRKFSELRLTRRIKDRPLPEITVVDLRNNRQERGVRRFITPLLEQEIRGTLSRREQVLLFLNRRGFASFPLCAGCGQPIRCKNCDITLTHHQQARAFKCHHCGYSRAAASTCPACGSPKIQLLGVGTEKLQAAVQKLFPEARIARLDRDTTLRRGAILRILRGIRDGRVDVLIGTQMVAKGHDFPNITLVGIVCADLTLSFPDFRSGERTFQLLAQVSGRAGRGTSPGRVVLQTYAPDHFSIQAAREQDFRAFYNHEIPYRKALGYPPFSRLAQIKISARDQHKAAQAAYAMGQNGRSILKNDTSLARAIELMGPIEAPLPKIASRYRWQVLLKGRQTGPLHRFLEKLALASVPAGALRDVRVVIDIDPFFML